MIRSSIALVILLGLGLGIAQARIDEPPAGLTVVDWAQIRALYEQHRHTATLVDDGSYLARNPRQGWSIRFDGRGFTVRPDEGDWSWGLELVSFGVEGAPQAIVGKASIRAEHGRVNYGWRPELEEWFVNDQRGLEHGWTVRQRPLGAGERLELELAVRGGLRPEVKGTAGSGVQFVDEAGAAVVRYAGLKAWDADGKALAARMTVSVEGGLTIAVDDRGAHYPVTVDPVAVQTAYIKASNTGPDDYFGSPVALSGDVLAVGADGEDSSGGGGDPEGDNSELSSGAVYVFRRVADVWTQEAYLKSGGDAGDLFGTSLALEGNTLVIGAVGEDGKGTGSDREADNSIPDSGAAYVYEWTLLSGWQKKAYLKAPNPDAADSFGRSVALSGDTIAVGAPGEDGNGTGFNPGTQLDNSVSGAGAVYLFIRSSSGIWAWQDYIKASNPDAGDRFGWSVSLLGDTLAVGAYLEDGGGVGVNPSSQGDNSSQDAGAVYVFSRTVGVWSQQAYLKASNPDPGDHFGDSVALTIDTLAVGASQEDASGSGVNPGSQADNSSLDSGAAYVFSRFGSIWAQQAYLKASNPDALDRFGWSVTLSGDALVIGAHQEDGSGAGVNPSLPTDNSTTDSGAAYVFTRIAGAWTHQAYIKASNPDPSDQFGWSVALSGNTLAVGGHLEDGAGTGVNPIPRSDNSAHDSGGVYTFALCPSIALTATTTTVTGMSPSPARAGEPYAVSYSVTNGCGETVLGSVQVSNGSSSNTCTVTAGSCELVSPVSGSDQITVSYLGDGQFEPSSTVAEQDVKWPTTVTVGAIGPSPSVVGQPYTVAYTVTSPGGTPVGDVLVSDGYSSNTCTVSDGSCSLTSTTGGGKTITVSYLGDEGSWSDTPLTASVTCQATINGITIVETDPEACRIPVTFPGAGYAPIYSYIFPQSQTSASGFTYDSQASAAANYDVSFDLEAVGGASFRSNFATTLWFDGQGFGTTLFSAGLTDLNYFVNAYSFARLRIYQNGVIDRTVRSSSAISNGTLVSDRFEFSRQRPLHISIEVRGDVDQHDLFTNTASTLTSSHVSLRDIRDSAGGAISIATSPDPSVTYFDDSVFAPSSATTSLLINPAPTTTTVGAILPSPAPVGIGYEVPFTVTSALGTPTGNVTVSDGESSNTCQVSASTCVLASVTAGAKTITVSYLGDSNFAASTDTGAQTINPALTVTTAGQIQPSPSALGEAYAVAYSVTSAGGTPTGNVTVTDGSASNTCSVAAGSCSLTSTTVGGKTITVSYLGSGNFEPSSDVGAQTVNPAATITTVGPISPSFPLVGEAYAVAYSVTSAAGTPTGSVTVTDGSASNTCAVDAASCPLTSTTMGAKTVTASYLGDGNFAPSSGAGALQVCSYALTPTSNALTAAGGTGSILVTAPDTCPWTAGESLPWLSIVSGASGVGTGTIGYQVDPNASVLGRSGEIVVADQTHAVTQSGVACTYSITPATNSLGAAGGSGAIFVTTPPTCAWAVSENLSWVSIVSGSSGSGDGTVAYQVSPFAQAGVRQGDITVAGKTHAITQAGGATLAFELGAFTNGAWFLDRNGDFAFDGASEISGWGSPGDTPVNGDWNGDGFRDLGVFSNGTWFLDRNGDTAFDPATEIQGWGAPGWIPVTGDWNGDGKTEIGAVDPTTSTWFLDLNGDFAFDPATEIRGWGSPGDTPVVGDWDGDGDDDIGVFSGGTWFIDFNGDGGFQLATDQRGWGVAGWIPVVGDWDGDGADEIGAIEPTSMAWFRDVNGDFLFDPATELIGWGSPGDQPVVADWNGDGSDDVGVFSGGTWFIDAAGDGAFDPATDIRGWGVAGWTPVPGAWQ